MDLVTVDEAKALLRSLSIRRKSDAFKLGDLVGRWLSKPIIAPMSVPSFDNSAMDGYAVAWQDSGKPYGVMDEIQAGDMPGFVLTPGKAVRIFTGAPVPDGADTVIPQEFVEWKNGLLDFDHSRFGKGVNVRLQGAQCQVGQEVIPAGTRVTPGTIGLMASLGITEAEAFLLPRVGIVLTGDELIEVGQDLRPGQIYNSNGPALLAYLGNLGITDVSVFRALDEAEQVKNTLADALAQSDVLLITGGISVGDYDFVKKALEDIGVKKLFYKVKQRPGKPLYVGSKGSQVVFALPGNPASVLSCFIQYVKPFLEAYKGAHSSWDSFQVLPLEVDFQKNVPMTFFLKARIQDGKAQLLPGQESFNLLPFGVADGLVEIPWNMERIGAGEPVRFYPW